MRRWREYLSSGENRAGWAVTVGKSSGFRFYRIKEKILLKLLRIVLNAIEIYLQCVDPLALRVQVVHQIHVWLIKWFKLRLKQFPPRCVQSLFRNKSWRSIEEKFKRRFEAWAKIASCARTSVGPTKNKRKFPSKHSNLDEQKKFFNLDFQTGLELRC